MMNHHNQLFFIVLIRKFHMLININFNASEACAFIMYHCFYWNDKYIERRWKTRVKKNTKWANKNKRHTLRTFSYWNDRKAALECFYDKLRRIDDSLDIICVTSKLPRWNFSGKFLCCYRKFGFDQFSFELFECQCQSLLEAE